MKTFKRQFYLWLRGIMGKSSERFSPHGIDVFIPKDADIDIRYLLAKGRPYEQEEADFVKQYIESGTDVIEFGGCMGVVSALIRNRIGQNAHHTIVEASPDLAKICKTNATANSSEKNTNVIQAAVDYSGAKSIRFSLGHNAHVGHLAKSGEAGIDVPTTTLSKIVAEAKLKKFAFVCDIEGAEIALFENENTIFKNVTTIILETHPAIYPNKQDDFDALITRIENLGFVLKQERNNVACFLRA